MKFKEHHSAYVKLEPKDIGFIVNDGLTVYNRAALEISCDCPSGIKYDILAAVNKGWLKPIAYVHESELMFNRIKGPEHVDS